jgi:ArsR family transcriptional regulator
MEQLPPNMAPRCCPPPAAPGPAGLRRHAPLLRALSDPTRLSILELLLRARGSLCACDIEGCFDLSQPTVSHHLRLLREAGLVRAQRRGTWMHYELELAGLDALRSFTHDLVELSPSLEGDSHGEEQPAGAGRTPLRSGCA